MTFDVTLRVVENLSVRFAYLDIRCRTRYREEYESNKRAYTLAHSRVRTYIRLDL